MTNYNSALTSIGLDATYWTCSTIWFDFDYKLEDVDANGTEKLDVEVFWDTTWHQEAELVNNGSTGWNSKHLNISSASGNTLRVRFRANGQNTQHILNWYIDNIHIYPVCASPLNLNATENANAVSLTWTQPVCGPNGQVTCLIYDDGTMESGWSINPGFDDWLGNLFPVPASENGYLHSFDLLWWNYPNATVQAFTLDVFSQAGVLLGSSQTFTVPVPAPVTFMTVTLPNDIPFTGPFYGMVHWAGLSDTSNYLGFDSNGPHSQQNLAYYYDGITFSPVSLGPPPGVFTEHACAFLNGNDHPVMLGTNSDSSDLVGYDVYRYDSVPGAVVAFHKINTAVITTTSYTDLIGADTIGSGIFEYFVTALFNNSITGTFLCESPGSDTVMIQYPAVGIHEVSGGSILLFPNPATDILNVRSEFSINRIEILNFTGQTVYNDLSSNTKLAVISTSSLPAGVYFVKVTTQKGISTAKITVVH